MYHQLLSKPCLRTSIGIGPTAHQNHKRQPESATVHQGQILLNLRRVGDHALLLQISPHDVNGTVDGRREDGHMENPPGHEQGRGEHNMSSRSDSISMLYIKQRSPFREQLGIGPSNCNETRHRGPISLAHQTGFPACAGDRQGGGPS